MEKGRVIAVNVPAGLPLTLLCGALLLDRSVCNGSNNLLLGRVEATVGMHAFETQLHLGIMGTLSE